MEFFVLNLNYIMLTIKYINYIIIYQILIELPIKIYLTFTAHLHEGQGVTYRL